MKKCYICGRTNWIERHHVFYGPFRKKSEKYEMVVYLCHFCHNEPPNGVHFNRQNDLKLKAEFQKKFMEEHSEMDFIKEFGRNYL